MTPDDPRHGTYAGYMAHYREAGVNSVCDPCRQAKNVYQCPAVAAWRDGNPEKQRAIAVTSLLRQRALRELGKRHPEEFALIVADLKAAS